MDDEKIPGDLVTESKFLILGKSRADLWQFAANVALEVKYEDSFAYDFNLHGWTFGEL